MYNARAGFGQSWRCKSQMDRKDYLYLLHKISTEFKSLLRLNKHSQILIQTYFLDIQLNI